MTVKTQSDKIADENKRSKGMYESKNIVTWKNVRRKSP